MPGSLSFHSQEPRRAVGGSEASKTKDLEM